MCSGRQYEASIVRLPDSFQKNSKSRVVLLKSRPVQFDLAQEVIKKENGKFAVISIDPGKCIFYGVDCCVFRLKVNADSGSK